MRITSLKREIWMEWGFGGRRRTCDEQLRQTIILFARTRITKVRRADGSHVLKKSDQMTYLLEIVSCYIT